MINWIQTNSDGLIIGIFTGIVASFFVAGIIAGLKKLYWRIKIGRSEYSGKWQQLIYDNDNYDGKPIKIDEYQVKHKKFKYTRLLVINMTGTISRKYPSSENNYRKWDFIGYLDGDILTILYQSKEGQKSRGCIYVKLSHQDGQDDFRGFYLEEHKDGTIDKTPVIIRKDRG